MASQRSSGRRNEVVVLQIGVYDCLDEAVAG